MHKKPHEVYSLKEKKISLHTYVYSQQPHHRIFVVCIEKNIFLRGHEIASQSSSNMREPHKVIYESYTRFFPYRPTAIQLFYSIQRDNSAQKKNIKS